MFTPCLFLMFFIVSLIFKAFPCFDYIFSTICRIGQLAKSFCDLIAMFYNNDHSAATATPHLLSLFLLSSWIEQNFDNANQFLVKPSNIVKTLFCTSLIIDVYWQFERAATPLHKVTIPSIWLGYAISVPSRAVTILFTRAIEKLSKTPRAITNNTKFEESDLLNNPL